MKIKLLVASVVVYFFSIGCAPPSIPAKIIDWVCDPQDAAKPCDVVANSAEYKIYRVQSGADIESLTVTSKTVATMKGGNVGTLTSNNLSSHLVLLEIGTVISGGTIENLGVVSGVNGVSIDTGSDTIVKVRDDAIVQGHMIGNGSSWITLLGGSFTGLADVGVMNNVLLNNGSTLHIVGSYSDFLSIDGSNCKLIPASTTIRGVLISYKILAALLFPTNGFCELTGNFNNGSPFSITVDARNNSKVVISNVDLSLVTLVL